MVCALAFASSGFAAKAPLGVFYSFDKSAPSALLGAMQSELARILSPSGLSADWRANDGSRDRGDDFPGIVVFRYHGQCTFLGIAENGEETPGGEALAETDTVDGHVLPFAGVNCDRIRALIAPALKQMPASWKNEMLGRALARVTAHEIYHMLAGVRTHDDRGIFQAGHSRRDLTAASFAFAAQENNWLHSWVQRQAPQEQVVQSSPAVASSSDDATYGESDSAAGR